MQILLHFDYKQFFDFRLSSFLAPFAASVAQGAKTPYIFCLLVVLFESLVCIATLFAFARSNADLCSVIVHDSEIFHLYRDPVGKATVTLGLYCLIKH